MRRITSALLLAFCLNQPSSATLMAEETVIFSTDFTEAEGFAREGDALRAPGIEFTNEGRFDLDSSGTGHLLRPPANGFVNDLRMPRFSFGDDLINNQEGLEGDLLTEQSVLNLRVGDVIRLDAFGLEVSSGRDTPAAAGTSFPQAGLLLFGLANTGLSQDDTQKTVSSFDLYLAPDDLQAIGGTLILGSTGNILIESQNELIETGVATLETFDYSVDLIAEGGGLFTVEQLINGSVLSAESSVSPDFSRLGLDTAGLFQTGNFFVNYRLDGLRLSIQTTAVPEPNAGLILTSALAVAAAFRR